MSFIPILNQSDITTGYAYTVEEDGVVSVYTFDLNYELIGTSITDTAAGISFSDLIEDAASGGGTVESGTQVEGDYSRSFEFNYDSGGNFTGGTETINGATTTYDANWAVLSVTISINDATALTPEEKDKLPPAVLAGLASEASVYKIITESDDYSLQTLYKNNAGEGAVIGYIETFTFDDDVQGSNSTYSDADWNFVGHRWDDSYSSGYHFVTQGVGGAYTETGANSAKDGS
jgi:hypothetical protein